MFVCVRAFVRACVCVCVNIMSYDHGICFIYYEAYTSDIVVLE